MPKISLHSWFILGSFSMLAFGCADMSAGRTPTTVTQTTAQTLQQVQSAWYGEKVRVAVMEFDNKTGTEYQISQSTKGTQVGNPIGNGMKEQMVTALMQTGQFIVLERVAVKGVLSEQEFGKSGAVKQETAATVGEMEGAEFLIYGAVTEYLPGQASLSAGGGLGTAAGMFIPVPGASLAIDAIGKAAASASASQDHVAIDIRMVDVKTGRVVNATSVEGSPQDYGASLGGIFGSALLGVSTQVQTPIQKAVRACIIKAVNWVADNALEYRKTVATKTPPPQPQPKKSAPKKSVVKGESSPSSAKPEEKPKPKPEKVKSADEWGQ